MRALAIIALVLCTCAPPPRPVAASLPVRVCIYDGYVFRCGVGL
jgi:hypothetical protein